MVNLRLRHPVPTGHQQINDLVISCEALARCSGNSCASPALTPFSAHRPLLDHCVIGNGVMGKRPFRAIGEESVLFQPSVESRGATMKLSTATRLTSTNVPMRRVLLVQTQAENAGAQEITRLLGTGLRAS